MVRTTTSPVLTPTRVARNVPRQTVRAKTPSPYARHTRFSPSDFGDAIECRSLAQGAAHLFKFADRSTHTLDSFIEVAALRRSRELAHQELEQRVTERFGAAAAAPLLKSPS